ncbi:MotA/TolQ/ExbB proton channel family protein [Magnetospirillum aberrantis]|uniref:Biopolymer transport protein ExbB n=1 Tax=Magnetospirillum aberrantis SpK TaxID=908842 RepID=A0A7C9UXS8_9PROT|nr:MotA/TolQ/ExbB proton channel family protein [Magnetospirillum aberrantis]NFV79253.1 MotA/TolQ/ExbB proton channel family protein [Magnetospirillum aberrantis SpK]
MISQEFSTSLPELWAQGDVVARATLALLLLMSVTSWTVLVVKLVEQVRLLRQSRQAMAALGNCLSLEALPEDGLFFAIAQSGLEALRRHDGATIELDRNAMLSLGLNRALARSLGRLQGGLAALATIASTAPFVGLFGTVWGIHHALTAIGRSGQAAIDKVAGPVGEALVMTALGLAVAVPAVLAYNWLNRRNKIAGDSLRDFTAGAHVLLLAGRVSERAEPGQRPAVAPVLASRTA